MAQAITKEQKEVAKRDGKLLIQVTINANHLTHDEIVALKGKVFMGNFSMSGPVDIKEARELWCWYLRYLKRSKGKK